MNPTINKITRRNGVAGQVQFDAEVTYTYEDTEPEVSLVSFVGSIAYGGPVVMITPGNPKGTFVTRPDRFGDFGEQWVRRFFTDTL